MSITGSDGNVVPLKKDGPFNKSANELFREVHEDDDVDSDARAHHHTLGVGPTQAASGSEFAKVKAIVDEISVSGTGPTGPMGPQGPVGPMGPAGADGGGSGGANFVLEQTFSSAVTPWVITHNKGTKGISVYTTNLVGVEIEGDPVYPDINTVQVHFYYAQTGIARVYY